MSAPGQGAPAGGDAGQQGAEGQQQDAGLDPQQINDTLSQLASGQEQLREFLQTQPWQQEAAAEPDPAAQAEPVDLSFLDPASAEFDPAQMAQQFQQAVRTEAERVAQEMVGPVRQQVDEMSEQQEWGSLVGEFPEMAERETAEPVLQLTGMVAGQLAESLGLDQRTAARLAQHPRLARIVYMAGRAADAANAEEDDVPSPATAEGGTGAAPGAGQADLGDAIVGAGRAGSRVLPFG